jgi:hypothetical protein
MKMTRLEVDPIQLGNLEVGWWRAHNDKDKSKMAHLLIEQNMALYGFSSEDAKASLQDLVEGVSYHDTRQWDEAVNAVTGYYQKIKEKTGLRFNPAEVAKLEVGWWQLHDELEHNPNKTPLADAFAKLYATQFGLEIEKMKKAGQLKAEATREHDLAEDPDTLPNEVESHWDKANQLLIDFYGELKNALA